MNQLAVNKAALNVNLDRVYEISSKMPSEFGEKFEGIPSFDRLYEEYNDFYLTKETTEELIALREEFTEEVFSVEHGFVPSWFGLPKEAQFFNLLVEQQLFFVKDGKTYNNPIVKVW